MPSWPRRRPGEPVLRKGSGSSNLPPGAMVEFNAHVKILSEERIFEEMKKIGVAKEGQEIMAPKSQCFIIKLEGIPIKDAIILKQEALSLGMECALSWNVVSLKAEKTDALLFGTKKQFKFLSNKMSIQPFNGREISEELDQCITNFESSYYVWRIRNEVMEIKNTKIMGILNLTPDSFYDGGKYTKREEALTRINEMVSEGADIIDVGAESSRPGSKRIDSLEEMRRLSVILDDISSYSIPFSIDTYKPDVAEVALKKGFSIVNDIYGFRDEKMVDVVKEFNAGLVLMHMKGDPENMQENPQYDDVVSELLRFFRTRTKEIIMKGIKRDQITIDPGIGFGKNFEHNVTILRNLSSLKSLGYPILIGVSRKGFIGTILKRDVEERLIGSVAAALFSVINGARILRVHDVRETRDAIKIIEALK